MNFMLMGDETFQNMPYVSIVNIKHKSSYQELIHVMRIQESIFPVLQFRVWWRIRTSYNPQTGF